MARKNAKVQLNPRLKNIGLGRGLAVASLVGLSFLGPEMWVLTVPAIGALLGVKK